MANEEFEVSDVIPAAPSRVYEAWLSSRDHCRMTGGAAEVNAILGARFTAWDGYIEGRNLVLEPSRRIVQAWRSSEFPSDSPDSMLELVFEPAGRHTRITLRHSNIPEGQGESYRSGWADHYFEPMKSYFASAAAALAADPPARANARKRAAAKKPAKKSAAKRTAAKKAAKKKPATKKRAAARKQPAKRKPRR